MIENIKKPMNLKLYGFCLVLVLQCTKFGEVRKIFLDILSGNHLSYIGTLNDLCDLENEVKVTQF